MQKISFILVFVFTFIFAAGCGSGGGGGSGSGPVNTTPTESGRAIGQRNLQGYAVEVTHLGPVAPGATVTVRAVITAESGHAPPVEVAMALQADAPNDWTVGTLAAGTWSWNFTMPGGPGQRVWVRVVDADGNSAESGGEDFALP